MTDTVYNDEYETCAETRATLRVYHPDLDPDALTAKLGLSPMDISCFWASAYGHGGPALSPQSMQKLAQLELEIGFDVYFWGEDQREQQASGPQTSTRPGS